MVSLLCALHFALCLSPRLSWMILSCYDPGGSDGPGTQDSEDEEEQRCALVLLSTGGLRALKRVQFDQKRSVLKKALCSVP